MDFDKLDKMAGLTGEPCANWQAVVEEYKNQRYADVVRPQSTKEFPGAIGRQQEQIKELQKKVEFLSQHAHEHVGPQWDPTTDTHSTQITDLFARVNQLEVLVAIIPLLEKRITGLESVNEAVVRHRVRHDEEIRALQQKIAALYERIGPEGTGDDPSATRPFKSVDVAERLLDAEKAVDDRCDDRLTEDWLSNIGFKCSGRTDDGIRFYNRDLVIILNKVGNFVVDICGAIALLDTRSKVRQLCELLHIELKEPA